MIQTTFLGNLQTPVNQKLTTTSTTKIGNTANNVTFLAAFTFNNKTAGDVDCVLYHYQAVGAVLREIWSGTVPAKVSDYPEWAPVKLAKGDEIRASGANNVIVNLYYSTPSSTA